MTVNTDLLLLVALGLGAGVLAGMFGVGGGLVIVPGLVLLLKLDPKMAAGTSLGALVLPTGLLGAYEYYRSGYIDLKAAVVVAVGLFLGAYVGARIMIGLDPALTRRLYGIFLLLMGARLLISAK
jgi:uncharacterized membrane protein YfcA